MAENGSGDAGLEQKIAKQIEYYFGDMNLMRDRFLKEKMQEDDGWVPIETMLKFNRLRQLSEDSALICQALKNSTAGLMEVNEAGDKIRRTPSKPLPGDTKERREEITSRSVYAKTFPLDVTLDELMSFFEGYGPVDNVFMKRDFHKKTFKGSAFATYTNKEDAEKFIKEEATKYKDTALESKMLKSDYFKEKNSKRREKPEAALREEAQKQVEAQEQQSNEEKAKQQMTKNAVLHIEGLSADTAREDVRNFFSDFGNVGWVDFDKGDTKGYLRLKEPNSAEPTLEKAKAAGDGKIVINSQEIQVRVVEGDEELEYWTKMFQDISEKHKQKKQFRGDRRRGGGNQRGGRRNRGGPQGKRKREDEAGDAPEDEGDDEPDTKSTRVEEADSTEQAVAE